MGQEKGYKTTESESLTEVKSGRCSGKLTLILGITAIAVAVYACVVTGLLIWQLVDNPGSLLLYIF